MNSNFTIIYDEFNGNINSTNLAADSVTTAKITDANVTRAKIADAAVDNTKIATRTRFKEFDITADGSGGVVEALQESNSIALSGTPTQYARGDLIVPNDYDSGDATINLIMYSDNTQTENTKYYIGARGANDAQSLWNVVSGYTSQTVALTANTNKLHTLTTTVPEADLEAGGIVVLAWQISSAITGTVYLIGGYLSYTADM
jgi:hypothetical protein